jgi:hypothetical protein
MGNNGVESLGGGALILCQWPAFAATPDNPSAFFVCLLKDAQGMQRKFGNLPHGNLLGLNCMVVVH